MKDTFDSMVAYLKNPSKVKAKTHDQNVRAVNKLLKPVSAVLFLRDAGKFNFDKGM